ncbi:lin0354 protein [Ruminococcus sp. CAG:403]|nr:lin0354 protein [Ruminococcus sp. CAG:403]
MEYFTALQWLNCSGNNLKELNVRQNIALQLLYCYDNQLTELDVSQNMALKELYCFGNQLTELDLDQNLALQVLNCSSNQLRELDVSQNTALQTLYCDSNDLTKLDVRQNSELQILGCYDNQLKELDVSQNTALKELYCHNNNLTELDLSQNSELIDLDCSNNTYSIVLTGGTFDLSTLPGTFDVSKASNWTNATVDGNTLTVTDLKANVTYTYDLGNGKTATFTLHPASCTLTESMVEAIPVQSHTGSEVTPDVTLKCGDTILQKDIDYTISYASNVEIGTATATFTLHPTSCTLTESMVEAIPDQIYTGLELTPEVTWKHAVKDTDYTISYKDNIDAGTATVTITGKKFWEGSITIPFTILPADLTDAEIKLKEEKLVYNGTEQSPSIGSITVGDVVLTEDDYTITGNTATESGTYTLTIQGKGNFTGKATAEWSIVKATPTVTPVIPDQKYTEGDNLPELGYNCKGNTDCNTCAPRSEIHSG